MLVEQILKGIGDKRLLSDHKPGPSPLDDLIQGYSKKAAHNDDLPNLAEEATGRDLKNAIKLMDPEDQVTLLYKYSQATGSLMDPSVYSEHPKDAEERRLRHWFIKAGFYLAAVLLLMVTGAVVVLGSLRGEMSNPLASGILSTALEILKLIFSTSNMTGG